MVKSKKYVRIKDVDSAVWNRFLSYVQMNHNRIYGYVGSEFNRVMEKGLDAVEGEELQQHHLQQSSTPDTFPKLRVDVRRRLGAVRTRMRKYLKDTEGDWGRMSMNGLRNVIDEAIQMDERTRRRYTRLLFELGGVKQDLEDLDFVNISLAWLKKPIIPEEQMLVER